MPEFNELTVQNLVYVLVGAASTTRFWDELPDDYPNGAGTFREGTAGKLAEAALENWAVIAERTRTNYGATGVRLTHSEDTLFKVYEALREAGLSDAQTITAVNLMQNAGIYFREAEAK